MSTAPFERGPHDHPRTGNSARNAINRFKSLSRLFCTPQVHARAVRPVLAEFALLLLRFCRLGPHEQIRLLLKMSRGSPLSQEEVIASSLTRLRAVLAVLCASRVSFYLTTSLLRNSSLGFGQPCRPDVHSMGISETIGGRDGKLDFRFRSRPMRRRQITLISSRQFSPALLDSLAPMFPRAPSEAYLGLESRIPLLANQKLKNPFT